MLLAKSYNEVFEFVTIMHKMLLVLFPRQAYDTRSTL